ncbi:DUF6228 family protein [Streptomyces sp. WC2508]|uniref:DUF6228 family protein n=1 Tax=Streptomyces sp. WC2508 TaxID=3461405 RepID=UPI0040440406
MIVSSLATIVIGPRYVSITTCRVLICISPLLTGRRTTPAEREIAFGAVADQRARACGGGAPRCERAGRSNRHARPVELETTARLAAPGAPRQRSARPPSEEWHFETTTVHAAGEEMRNLAAKIHTFLTSTVE